MATYLRFPEMLPVPVAQGGTGSTTAMNNNRFLVSSSGNIVEASAVTANSAMASDANGLPVASAVTATQLGYLSTASSDVQTQINAKQATLTLPLSIANGGTNSSSALGNGKVMVSSAGALVESSVTSTTLGFLDASSSVQTQLNAKQATLSLPLSVANGGTGLATSAFPTWTKYTTAHTALQTAGLTNNITLFTLPAKTVIHKVIMKHSTAFAGGTIATYTVSVGTGGSLTKYIGVFDVFQAVASATFGVAATTINQTPEDFTSGVAIVISAISTVGLLNASTQGSVDTWVLTSLLP